MTWAREKGTTYYSGFIVKEMCWLLNVCDYMVESRDSSSELVVGVLYVWVLQVIAAFMRSTSYSAAAVAARDILGINRAGQRDD